MSGHLGGYGGWAVRSLCNFAARGFEVYAWLPPWEYEWLRSSRKGKELLKDQGHSTPDQGGKGPRQVCLRRKNYALRSVVWSPKFLAGLRDKNKRSVITLSGHPHDDDESGHDRGRARLLLSLSSGLTVEQEWLMDVEGVRPCSEPRLPSPRASPRPADRSGGRVANFTRVAWNLSLSGRGF